MKNNFIKKFLLAVCSLVFAISGVFVSGGCSSSRDEVLRIYVPGEYIEQDRLDEFQEWYFEVTGKHITVEKREFDTNETMYTMIATKHQEYDIICPSDYMAERMMNEGLLLKLDDDIMHNGYTDINGEEYDPVVFNLLGDEDENADLIDIIRSFDPSLDYASPYMWGTMGIMYYYDGDQSLEPLAPIPPEAPVEPTMPNEEDFDSEEEYNLAINTYYLEYNQYLSDYQDYLNSDEYEEYLNSDEYQTYLEEKQAYDEVYHSEKQAVMDADSEKSSWKSLFDVTKKNIYMKDSERDTYTVALFDYYYDQILLATNNLTDFTTDEYKTIMNEIFTLGEEDFDEKLEHAKQSLQRQKQYVYDYESDEGKDDLLTSKGAQGYYGMFWSCDAGYIIAQWEGDEVTYNTEFRYIVPDEGSNVWVDCFCIPKYAKNITAANLFILFMSDPEVAFSCMDYTGCTSAVYQTTVDYLDYLYPEVLRDGTYTVNEFYSYLNTASEEELLDAGYIDEDGEYTFESTFVFETSDSFKSMYLSLMFPNLDIDFIGSYQVKSPLERCGIMRALGDEASDKLLVMWSSLRREITTEIISPTTWIILGVIAGITVLSVGLYFSINAILDLKIKKSLAKTSNKKQNKND